MPQPLGYTGPLLATIAPTGQPNAGFWSVDFTSDQIGITLSQFECYRIVVQDGPVGSTFNVVIGGVTPYDSVYPGWSTSWDPNQTMKLNQGQTVSFRWNSAQTPAPSVTMYFQELSL